MTESQRILDSAEVDFLLEGGKGDGPAKDQPVAAGSEQAVTMRGNLDQINLSDIFQTLSMTKMEGVLEIQSPIERRQVYCRDGYVQVLVPPRLIHRRIGQRLVNAGFITPEQLRSALMRQRKEKKQLGVLLIEDGVITEEHIEQIANIQVAEDLFSLFTWRHGTFAFYKGEVADLELRESFSRCPEFEVSSLLLEVARRADEWESILAVIGNLDEIPVRTSEDDPQQRLGELEYTLFRAADGKSSYRTLAEQTTHALFEVARSARDLVRSRVLANLDDQGMVMAADSLVLEGNQRQAVLVLQTLRDRPGERRLEVVRSMAEVLQRAGENRLAGVTLLDVARVQTEPEVALSLAREANELAPHDTQTLTFLRTTLVAHGTDGVELDKVTLSLLDALLAEDHLDQVLQVVTDARNVAPPTPQILMREAKARQKQGDVAGATTVLLEIVELHRAVDNRSGQVEAYEAILRLDRSNKDAQRALHKLRQTKIGRIVRVASALVAAALTCTMAIVWWEQRSFEEAVRLANREIGDLLKTGDRFGARERLEHWCTALGEGEVADDLRRQVDFADAAELNRQAKVARKRMQERLLVAAAALEAGNIVEAFAVYEELLKQPDYRIEVNEVIGTRVDALVLGIDRCVKALSLRMPAEPTLRLGRNELQDNYDLLKSLCNPTLLKMHEELDAMQRAGNLPACIDETRRQAIVDIVLRARAPLATARERTASYATAIANATEQRQFDPTFKEAMRREEARDFAGALDLYRLLEKLEGVDPELRTMFRDRVSRNATIVRLLDAEAKAATAGDFETARQHLRALRTSFPDVPFDGLVRLPLRIDTHPAGARVLCNDRELAVTPCAIAYVPAETTKLEIHLTGFEPESMEVTGDICGAIEIPLRLRPDQEFALAGVVEAAPAVDGDVLWLVDRGGAVRALRDGATEPSWSFRTGDMSGWLTPILAHGDLLVFGSVDGDLRALTRAKGELAWSVPALPTESPLLRVGDHVLVATSDDRLAAVAVADHSVRTLPMPGSHRARLLASGSRAFVLTAHTVTMVTMPEFAVGWQRALSGSAELQGTVVDQSIVVVDDQGQLLCLDTANGEPRWRRRLDAGHLGGVCLDDAGVLLTLPGQLVRYEVADGSGPRMLATASRPWTSPVQLVGKRLLLQTADGRVEVRERGTGTLLYALPGAKGSHVLPYRDGVILSAPDRTLGIYRHLR